MAQNCNLLCVIVVTDVTKTITFKTMLKLHYLVTVLLILRNKKRFFDRIV